MPLPFHVNGVQTLAFDPDEALARLRDPAAASLEVAPEFVRLLGVAAGFEPDEAEDEDEERARLEDLEYEAAREVWRDAWPELLHAVRAGPGEAGPLGPLPSAALYAFLHQVGARVGRPIDIPPERGALVDWLLAEGLERWLGAPSEGIAGLALHPTFEAHVLERAGLAARLEAARPTAEVVRGCPAARDPSAAFALERLVDGLAKNLRGVEGEGTAVAVFANFIRDD